VNPQKKVNDRWDSMQRRLLAGLYMAITAACTQADVPPTLTAGDWTVRDRLGVTIVESANPLTTDTPLWRIAGRPRVEIGVIDGADEYTFGQLRSAWRLSDSRIVAADEIADEIRFYSPRGRYLRSVGRDGEGPGEFRAIWSVRPFTGDSVFVFDYRLGRVSLFDAAGRFGRTVHTSVPAPNYWVVASLEDSLFALTSPGEGRPPFGISRDSSYLFAYNSRAERFDTLGRYPLAVRYRGGTNLEPEQGFFLPYASFAPAGDHYYWGLGDRWEIKEYRTDGNLARVIRLDRPVEPLTEDRIARFKRSWPEYVAALSGQRGEGNAAAMSRYVERGYFPATLPAYSKLIADSEGYLWAEQYRHPSEASQGWIVFDSIGRWLGHIAMPDHVEVEQIGRDFVLGIRVDSLGIQSVVVYDLARTPTL
jgi:hypothetical protein